MLKKRLLSLHLLSAFLIFLGVLNQVHAFIPKEKILKYERVFLVTPGFFNPKYFSIGFGFITQKKILTYHYNAYVIAFAAEESYTTHQELRAGALGGKGGVLLPVVPWVPIFLESAVGFAKTALHKDPWLGKSKDSIATRTQLLIQGGVLVRHRKMLFFSNYQINNLNYFSKKLFVGVGYHF